METKNLLSSLPAAQAVVRAVEEAGQRLVRNLSRQVAEAKPMPVVAGPVGPSVSGIARSVAPEDPVFAEKCKGLRKKGESLLAFCGRTELTLHEIRTKTRRELERLIALRAEARKWEGVEEPKHTPIPSHLKITFDASGDLDGHYSRPRLPGNVITTE